MQNQTGFSEQNIFVVNYLQYRFPIEDTERWMEDSIQTEQHCCCSYNIPVEDDGNKELRKTYSVP